MKTLEDETFYYSAEESLSKEKTLKRFKKVHQIERDFIKLYLSYFQEFFAA